MNEIKYFIEDNPDTSDDKVIRTGIVDFNAKIIKEKSSHFSVFAKDSSQIIGGALIWEHSDALYIDVLWCNEKYRKQGIGTKIIIMIDDVAKNKSLPKIFVDTYEFQAQDFYEKHGFCCRSLHLGADSHPEVVLQCGLSRLGNCWVSVFFMGRHCAVKEADAERKVRAPQGRAPGNAWET